MKFSRTLEELKIYLNFAEWLRKYVVYYVQLKKTFKKRITSLLRMSSKTDIARKIFSSKARIDNSSTVELEFFKTLQIALSQSIYLIHHDSNRLIYIDLDVFKEFEFEAMIFHVKDDLKEDFKENVKSYSFKNDIESIMFLSRLLIFAETRYWSIELKIVDFVWVLKKVRHLIESSFKIILWSNKSKSLKIIVYTELQIMRSYQILLDRSFSQLHRQINSIYVSFERSSFSLVLT